MDSYLHKAEAGPSDDLQAEWRTETTRSQARRSRNIVIGIVTLLLVGFLLCVKTEMWSELSLLRWHMWNGSGNYDFSSTGTGGDKYLTGVGKADITGYVELVSVFHKGFS